MTRAAAFALVALVSVGSTTSAAQGTVESLDARVNAVGTGRVRFSFAARDGVCGDGNNWYRTRPGTTIVNGNRDIEVDCDRGPVRVVVVRDGGVTTDVRTYVGGRWRADTAATDIGILSAPVAARWLLQRAEDSDPKPARGAIVSALLADSLDAWPSLLRIAKNERLNSDIRSQAVFWLADAAGEKVTAQL